MEPGAWWDVLRLKLRAVFRKERADLELREELQSHLEHQIDEHVARGVPRDQARTLAIRQLGGLESQMELGRDARGVNAIDHVVRDIRGAARLLRRTPGFTAIAVLSLALGIGANATIFQLLDAVRLRSLPVRDPGRLAVVDIANREWVGNQYSGRYASVTTPLWDAIQVNAEPFDGLLAWSHATMDLATRGESRFVENGLYVSGDFFKVLGVGAAAGRLFTSADDAATCPAPVVVLSHAFWQREYGGSRSAVGASLTLNSKPFTIVGVAASGFYGIEVGRSFDVAVPLCAQWIIDQGSNRRTDRGTWWLGVMGRLKPDWSLERASAHLETASASIFQTTLPENFSADDAEKYRAFRFTATPGAGGFSQLRDRYDDSLWLLLAVAGAVLLIACANLANLLLARMSAREREMAVRLAIGASRGRLIQQLFIESLMLAGIGTVAGAIVAPVLGRVIVGLISSDVNPTFVDLTPDWRVIGFLASLGVFTAVLFGLAPALRAARVPPGSVMQGASRSISGGTRSFAVRRVLVAVQIALSLVLLVGGLLFARSLFNLLTTDAGFTPAGLLEVDVDMRSLNLAGSARATLRDRILQHLREVPGIEHVATVASVPFVGNWYRRVYFKTDDGLKGAMGRFNRVSPGYFHTVATPVLQGRDFDATIDTPSSARVAIVNRAFAHTHFGDAPPIGLEFRPEGARGGEPGDTTFQIVGVVGDTKHGSLREPFDPIVYVSESQLAEPGPFVNIFVRPRSPEVPVADDVRVAVSSVNSGLAFHFHDVGRVRLESIAQDRLMALLCGGFAMLGAVLATIGVYGVMTYSLARRRSEIGVRMALGAGITAIIRMVIGEAALVVGAGVIAGAAVAAATARTAAAQLYGLAPHDLPTFAGAIGLLFAVAMAAAYLPASRAARTDPTVALRHE
jgi:putative ABC transport system permease protein